MTPFFFIFCRFGKSLARDDAHLFAGALVQLQMRRLESSTNEQRVKRHVQVPQRLKKGNCSAVSLLLCCAHGAAGFYNAITVPPSGLWTGYCDQVTHSPPAPCTPSPLRQASGVMVATPLNSLSRRMGMALGATEAMTFDNPDVVRYAVQYAATLASKLLPKTNGSEMVQWFAL